MRSTQVFFFMLAAGLLGLTLPSLAQVASPQRQTTDAQLKASFENPPASARPMVRWWWPGGDVTDEEIARELKIIKDAGLGGVEIQSFKDGLNPLPTGDVARRVDSFLTPEWFNHVKYAIEEGGRLGLDVDLTFGSGWPFGGPYIPLELASQRLIVHQIALTGPATFSNQFPGSPLGTGEKLVAVIAAPGSLPTLGKRKLQEFSDSVPMNAILASGKVNVASSIVLTQRVGEDGKLKWDVPAGQWVLFSFIQGPTLQTVEGGAGVGTQWVLDHLKRKALDQHIEAVGEASKKYFGEDFGKSLRAIFCDSLEVTAESMYWTDDFLMEFQKRRGYDLTPYLPLVQRPGESDPGEEYPSLPYFDDPEIGERVRRDYWMTVSDLMIDNFYQPLIDWGHNNHLKVRIQAHGAPADLLRIYGHADYPETEVLYADGRYDFLKLASSGGHLFGKNTISSESFVWRDHPYETTPELMKINADELFSAGITRIGYHGFPYEYMDRPDPGWFPFSSQYELIYTFSSHLNFRNPFWPFFKPLNDYMGRVGALSQAGHSVSRVALYSHRLYYPSWMPVDEDYPLEYSLMANGYNFDFINEDTLLHDATVENHELHTPGSVYPSLVLRNETRITLQLAEKLRDFARAGLPIVFAEQMPSEEVSFKDYRENGKQIQQIMQEILGSPKASAKSAVDGGRGNVRFVQDATIVPELLQSELKIAPNVRFATPEPNVFFQQFQVNSATFFFFRNPKSLPQTFRVTLDAGRRIPQIWNPWTGAIVEAPTYQSENGEVTLDIHIDPYGSELIGLVDAPEERHVIRTSFPAIERTPEGLFGVAAEAGSYYTELNDQKKITTPIPEKDIPPALTLGPNWDLSLIGNDKDGKEWTEKIHAAPLRDWSLSQNLRYFSGHGHYSLDVNIPKSYLRPHLALELDLGEVHDVAEVWVNGQKIDSLIMRPYCMDVAPYLKPGSNHFEIIVTNTLRNRLVGDGAAGDPHFIMFLRRTFFMPSGLIGPVRLVPEAHLKLE
ncbi:MAG: glycosyl hydrolase [Candidatus Sulfotelmatobacter sp.]